MKFHLILFYICTALWLGAHSAQAQYLSSRLPGTFFPKETLSTTDKRAFAPSAKLSRVLSGLYYEFLNDSRRQTEAMADLQARYQEVMLIQDGKIAIEATAQRSATDLLADLQELGLSGGNSFGRMVSGWLPIGQLPALSKLNTLLYARPVYPPLTGIGATTTQGDIAQQSANTRILEGVDGSGIVVGILSDSYNASRLEEEGVLSGDLPGINNPNGFNTPVAVLEEFARGSDEGRAMAEIVHDVAPGAALAFHTAFISQPSFAQGILDLAAFGCDVIVDDVFYFAEPFFQDGILAQAVDEVARQGVSYFSLAGNLRRQSYESVFRSAGIFELSSDSMATGGIQLGAYELHDFDPGPGVDVFQRIGFPSSGDAILSFQWDDAFASVCPEGCAGADTDLDVFIAFRDQDFNSIAFASLNANVGNDPFEFLRIASSNFSEAFLLIGRKLDAPGPNPNPGLIKYVNYGANQNVLLNLEYATFSPTLINHANAEGAIAVGAVPYFGTPAFGADDIQLESFSSAGGNAIIFDVNGEETSPVVRQKPDICAPNRGNNTFFGIDIDGDNFPNFTGTSASAPHAAAVAALMLDASLNGLAPQQVRQILIGTAQDMNDPFTPGLDLGFDFGSGFGFVQAIEAVQEAQRFRIAGFDWVDANTDEVITSLRDGDVILLSEIGTFNLAIITHTAPQQVGSVNINLVGPIFRNKLENVAPYASFGNLGDNFFGQSFIPGVYTLTAVPFERRSGQGEAGLPLSITFTMVDDTTLGSESGKPSIFPNPISANQTLRLDLGSGSDFSPETRILGISIFNQRGEKVKDLTLNPTPGQRIYHLDVAMLDLSNGIYLMQLIRENEAPHLLRLWIND